MLNISDMQYCSYTPYLGHDDLDNLIMLMKYPLLSSTHNIEVTMKV